MIPMLLFSKHLQKESYYQDKFCKKMGGITEHRLEDATRVDCLTEKYAIEVDFAEKWAEAIGQSLHYALMTNKKAGVYLILENENEERFLKRLKEIAKIVGIRTNRFTICIRPSNSFKVLKCFIFT